MSFRMIFVDSMKFLLAMMILALAFGGYSAASHAMGTEDCSSTASTQLEECQQDGVSTDHDHAEKHEKNSAGKCMDCTHCCASSAAILQTKPLVISMIAEAFVIEPSQAQPQGRIFSLLRPPRTLA